jgi:hypothetical protein
MHSDAIDTFAERADIKLFLLVLGWDNVDVCSELLSSDPKAIYSRHGTGLEREQSRKVVRDLVFFALFSTTTMH